MSHGGGGQVPVYLNSVRWERLRSIMEYLSTKNSITSVSRSEAIGQAIDAFFLQNCPAEGKNVQNEVHAKV